MQVSEASEFATIAMTTAVLPTMHSDSMQSSNSKHLAFAVSMPITRMTLKKKSVLEPYQISKKTIVACKGKMTKMPTSSIMAL